MLLAAAALAPAQTLPPSAPVRTVTDTYFGTSVPDPYRYLEDMKSPDVAAWLKAQADFTRATLDRVPGRAALARRIGELGDAVPARVSGVQVNGTHYYYLKRLATGNVPGLYVRAGLAGKERLLVDPEAAKGARRTHFAIDYYAPSFDNKYVAYGVSPGGSEESVLRVIVIAQLKPPVPYAPPRETTRCSVIAPVCGACGMHSVLNCWLPTNSAPTMVRLPPLIRIIWIALVAISVAP